MDLTSLIDTAAPTPFGWVITTQNEFDLASMVAFQTQLISLSRAFGPAKAATPEPVEAQINPR
jgi:hypothetical protein